MPYSTEALAGRTILVAEDEWMLADVIRTAIISAGGEVLGPFPSVVEAAESVQQAASQPDAAILNIRLEDGDSYPVADELTRRRIPFTFASANDISALPSRFSRVPLVQKPYAAYQVVRALERLLEAGEASG